MLDSTIAYKLDKAAGRPEGFNYMRLILALMVIASHAPIIVLGSAGYELVWTLPFLPISKIIVPSFFALSGFLVAASFERNKTLGVFFGLRAIRIFPALAFDTVVSALILGPLFTEFVLSRYFSDPLFAHYWLNILGEPQFSLPGVFSNHPVSGIVNSQLWTIPFELLCYISIGVIGLLGGQRKLWVAPAMAILVTVAHPLMQALKHQELLVDSRMAGMLIVAAFLWGVALYQHRKTIIGTVWSGMASLLVAMVLMSVHGVYAYLGCFAPIFVAHATVALGLVNPKPSKFSGYADYSYGLYLYGFPIQQVLMSFSWIPRIVTLQFVLAVFFAGIMSAISWRFVEKPALKARPQLKLWEESWLAHRARTKLKSHALPAPLD